MAGKLEFFMGDIYPNMSLFTTKSQTVAEAEDQYALVDNEELAEKHQVKSNPVQHKRIWIVLAVAIGFIVLMGGFHK
jgi:hypothetical protein